MKTVTEVSTFAALMKPRVARGAEERGAGICRTCLNPIWNEGGTIGRRKVEKGWSDRIEQGGDSIVCFSARDYRHVPITGREAEILRRSTRAHGTRRREAMSTIWHRKAKPRPFTVWEGDRDGAAHGVRYRFRWRAVIAAWCVSLYAGQDVWIERSLPGAVEPSQEPGRALRLSPSEGNTR